MFNSIGLLLSVLKGIFNTFAIHIYRNGQTSVFFPYQLTKHLLTLKVAITKSLSSIPKAKNTRQDFTNLTPTAPLHLHSLQNNHALY